MSIKTWGKLKTREELEDELDKRGAAMLKAALQAGELQAKNETLRTQLDAASGFIRDVLKGFPEYVPDGFQIQDDAERHGILIKHTPPAPCGEGCYCAEYYHSDDFAERLASCFRLAEWLAEEARP